MLTVNFPLNSTSLGASALHILENIERDYNFMPIGGVDISAFEPLKDEFKAKLNNAISRGLEEHDVKSLSLRLWHHFASLERVSAEQILYTFHELDNLTKTELNCLNQQKAVIVPCEFNKDVFKLRGVKVPLHVVPLGVDRNVFYPLEKYKNKNGPFTFVMAGKFEARKFHFEILQAFKAVFGDNPAIKLRCCVTNKFVNMQNVYQFITDKIFGGRQPNNVEFIDWVPTENHFADFLSHADCLISPSRGESFNLPLLQALSCGLQVITNADHAHKDYVNKDNAILIPSDGTILAQDDMFFRNDGRTNTGNWFTVTPNAIANGMIEAVKKGRSVNINGIETAKKLSWKNTADNILQIWDSYMI